ncbi:MAG: family 20 glycosylhydrolase [Microbacterium sp.]|nr:family 20 glycosylhydrolase [Microbacterium sp.]
MAADLLLPAPLSAHGRGGAFLLRAGTAVTVDDPALLPLGRLLVERIAAGTGIRLAAPEVAADLPPGSGAGVRLALDGADAALTGVPAARGVSPSGAPLDGERFAIDVDEQRIRLIGSAPAGLHHAVTVLTALAEQAEPGAEGISIPTLALADGPELAWRGLSFDVVRHAFAVEEVRTVIDLLARYRMNVLHLHLTDDQGWRVEIPTRPALTPDGSRFFTTDEYRSIIAYAAERHITVIPEIDMPGHSGTAISAYPELCRSGVAQPVYADPMEAVARMAADGFTPQYLDPEKDEVWAFVDDVIGAIAALTPGPFLHIGGDEAFGMPPELHTAFVKRAREIVRAHGKEPVGWQETSRADPGSDADGPLVQLWIGENALPSDPEHPLLQMLPPQLIELFATTFAEAADDPRRLIAQRARVIMSRTDLAYLDTPYAESSPDPEAEARRARVGMPGYPAATVERFATAPIPGLDAETDLDVIGFEAAIWCETVQSFDDLTFLLLPRLPVLAERAWNAGPARDWEGLRTRLAAQSPVWRRDGLTYFPAPSVDWR